MCQDGGQWRGGGGGTLPKSRQTRGFVGCRDNGGVEVGSVPGPTAVSLSFSLKRTVQYFVRRTDRVHSQM